MERSFPRQKPEDATTELRLARLGAPCDGADPPARRSDGTSPIHMVGVSDHHHDCGARSAKDRDRAVPCVGVDPEQRAPIVRDGDEGTPADTASSRYLSTPIVWRSLNRHLYGYVLEPTFGRGDASQQGRAISARSLKLLGIFDRGPITESISLIGCNM
jgi:hypothetical protein